MNERKYLIYLDILGFEALAEEIEEKTGVDSEEVRNKFIYVINEKIETIKRKGIIIGKHEGSDNWILVTDSLDNVFKSIFEILEHCTPYKGYRKIPLEIAIGTEYFDKWARFNGRELICEDSTIRFIKTRIINYYHKWYKNQYEESPKSTFIVFTESAYNDLEPLDKKICKEIKCQNVRFFAANVNKFRKRGKVLEFLERIGRSGSKRYGRINDVYEPPIEYNDIKRTLEEKRIVFITGTPEYGKTYTAVRLMWEYFNKGYEPRWIRGGEERERIWVREKLVDIKSELKPQHIVYFEDPFGKTKYERREDLEREIGTIINSIQQVKDVYVIITSREEVFKEFEKEKLSASELRAFEKRINIKKPSYDYERRKEILLKWAENENCKWLRNEELKNLVLRYIKYKKILPTPLAIHDFVIATIDIEKEDELREEIEKKSEETEKNLAKEIKNMSDDKILFLSFLFISDYFDIDFVKATYQELVEELDLKDAWEFDRLLNWFKDDKIELVDNKYIKFSHPSYAQSLKHILIEEDGYISQINKKIFSKLLLKLAEKDEAALAVARAVADNFDKLPEEVRNELLLKLSEEATWIVAKTVVYNFNRIPEEVRNKLLLKLAEKKGAARIVAWTVVDIFNKIPEEVRNKLLLKLSEKEEAARIVAWTVVYNFKKIREEVRNKLLLKLSENDRTAGIVIGIIRDNFNKIPKHVLLKLSENDKAAGIVARAVAVNFDELSEEARNELLLKLSENRETAGIVARIVRDNFNELPEEVRNELLLKLAEKKGAAENVAWVVAHNFNKIPEEVRNKLLLKLSEKEETARIVACIVYYNFNRILGEVRNELLLKLSENDKAPRIVAWVVADNFDKIPEEVRKRLPERVRRRWTN